MNAAPRLRWLAYSLLLSALMLSGIYWWRMSANHERLRTDVLEQASKRASQLAELQAHHMEALLIGIDQALKQFRATLQANNIAAVDEAATTAFASFPAGALLGFAVTDAKGEISFFTNTTDQGNVSFSRTQSPRRYYVGDREYFTFHQRDDKDRIYVGRPIFGRTSGRWVVPITRPLFEQGRFAGVVVISFSPTYLSNALARLTLERNDIASLLYSDGTYVARSQKLDDVMGKKVGVDRPFVGSGVPAQGIFRAPGMFDNVPRLFAWHKLESYDLIGVIGLDEQAIFASVEEQIALDRQRGGLAIGLILLLVSSVSILLIRAAHQQSQLDRHVAELDRIAHYDILTGIPNRRFLSDHLGQAVENARRNGKPLAVCCLDLDAFKPVNDQYGHGMGDLLLIEIARRLQSVLRFEDKLARLGGDEFVLLLNDLGSRESCDIVLNRVLATISQPITIDGITVSVSASIGVTLYPEDNSDADGLLRHADQAMYRAKEEGKNRYCFFDPERDRNIKDLHHQVQRLETALRNGEFILHYQPKVDLTSGAVIGVEALIRWRHPDKGLLSPGAFLHLMDGHDIEFAIGEWVIDSALRQMDAWRQQGLGLGISVNVSANHLVQEFFTDRLGTALQRYPGIAPADLELEIVETAALNDMGSATNSLARCRELGVRIALDDFGTGYSSLAYFRNLQVDILKIDQSFVRDMLTDPNDLEIVRSVIRLASAFNRQVIAEGVETFEHGSLLLSIGCSLCQGYGIACPMPAEELPAWVEQWRERGIWTSMNAGDSSLLPSLGI